MIGDMVTQGPGLIPRPIVAVCAIVVTGVWGASQIASIFIDGYEPPEAIHAALMIVLGSLFALRQGGEKKPDPGPPTAPALPPAPPPPSPDPPAVEPPAASRRGESGGLTLAELRRRLEGDDHAGQ